MFLPPRRVLAMLMGLGAAFAVACKSPEVPPCTAIDACHEAGTRNQHDQCTNPVKPDGTQCQTDACNVGGTCLAGACIHTHQVICEAVDSCHDVGSCDPNTGCSNPVKNTPCDKPAATLAMNGCSASDYTVDVTIGDGRSFALFADSGSEALAVAATACSDCTGLSPTYTPGATALDAKVPSSSNYGDNSGWAGEVYNDLVMLSPSIGDIRMDIVAITHASQNSGTSSAFFTDSYCSGNAVANTAQGIFGMAASVLGPFGTDSYLEQQAAHRTIVDAFTVQLCDLQGRLWLGGYDPNYTTSPLQFTSSDMTAGYYTVTLQDLQINGATLGQELDTLGTIVDTGTSLLVVPTQVFNALTNAIESDPNYVANFGGPGFLKGSNCQQANTTVDRAILDAVLPKLTMVFPAVGGGNVMLNLSATNSYLAPVLAPNDGNTLVTMYCTGVADGGAVVSSPGYPNIIMGNGFMHSQVVMFDRVHQQVGFAAQRDCVQTLQ